MRRAERFDGGVSEVVRIGVSSRGRGEVGICGGPEEL